MAPIDHVPGTFHEELAGSAPAILGVATSITAFVGRTLRGPVETPTSCRSFEEFVLRFGDLAWGHPTTVAVRDFFLNGGREAVIVRLFRRDDGDGRARVTTSDGLRLVATSPGTWGNGLCLTLHHPPGAGGDVFELLIEDTATGAVERFVDLALVGERSLDRVLATESQLLQAEGDLPAQRPIEAAGLAASGGSDGLGLDAAAYLGDATSPTGIRALDQTDLFNLLCIPPDAPGADVSDTVWAAAAAYCATRRALLLVDPPVAWTAAPATAVAAVGAAMRAAPPVVGKDARNAALYFPRLSMRDPLDGTRFHATAPAGAVAGVFARTDAGRGVWHAPAGRDAVVVGVDGLEIALDRAGQSELAPLAVNCLRQFPGLGIALWGARTLRGGDQFADEYRYVAVRRLALFLEESLDRGMRWAAFEPNGEPLWARLRLSVGTFMETLFRQGAFRASRAAEAYFVRCGADTTSQADIDRGLVRVVVGFAPLRPAEFVVLTLAVRAVPA